MRASQGLVRKDLFFFIYIIIKNDINALFIISKQKQQKQQKQTAKQTAKANSN